MSNPNRRGASSAGRGRGGSNWRPHNQYWGRGNKNVPHEKPTTVLLPIQSNSFDDTSRNVNDSSPCSTVSRSNVSVAPAGPRPYQSFLINNANPNTPYQAWTLYFPQEEYKQDSLTSRKVKSFENHFKDFPAEYNLTKIFAIYAFDLNIAFLLNDTKFHQGWNNFHQDLIEFPDITLSAAGLAMHTICFSSEIIKEIQSSSRPAGKGSCFKIFRARPQDFTPIDNLCSIRSKKYDRLISIRATVVQTGEAEIIDAWSTYACKVCSTEQAVKQNQGIIVQPSSCKKTGCCNRSKFTFLLYSPYTRMEKFQTIRVQQLITRGKKGEETKQLRHIEAELSNDLVDRVSPGDDVILTGILKVRPQEDNAFKQDDSLKMYIQAVAIFKEKSSAPNSRQSAFTAKDLQAVQMIQQEPCPFRLLVQSLCPSIYGHEMVKAGLILGLLGGSSNHYGHRSEIHVLMVGDPGVGKSEMLKACSQVSTKEVYVSGSSSSIAGLTVTVRSRKGGDNGDGGDLEGGALVLADEANCCIDEFDKIHSNQQAVLEVMEQQTVGVAKAGVYCSIPARTSVLAAANPSGGHYDRSKTVSENLKMSSPLLSRFDLIFVMIDKADQAFDSMLTEHVQALASGAKKLPTGVSFRGGNRNEIMNESSNLICEAGDDNLEARLKLRKGENMDLLPRILIQRYIAYAKKNCFPKLTEEAAEELKKFYFELRSASLGANLVPITSRQFEGLMRLTQARARADLTDEATKSHALDVISIVRFSMMDVFTTETGSLEISRNLMGSGVSQSTLTKRFLAVLQQHSATLKKNIFDVVELKEVAVAKGLSINFNQIIDSLNNQGYLLKKSANIYKLISG